MHLEPFYSLPQSLPVPGSLNHNHPNRAASFPSSKKDLLPSSANIVSRAVIFPASHHVWCVCDYSCSLDAAFLFTPHTSHGRPHKVCYNTASSATRLFIVQRLRACVFITYLDLMQHHPSFHRQIVLMTAGLACAGMGVALTTRAGLGTSPISSLPYVITFFSPLSFGTATFLVNIALVAAQAVLLRRNFQSRQWLQLAVVLLFGLFIDAGMWLSAGFAPKAYGWQLTGVLLGSAVLALGIALQIHADVMLNPGEGLVKTLCRVTHGRFARIKVCFDCTLVLAAGVLSWAVLHRIEGLREGTLLSAVAVGLFLRGIIPLTRPLRRWLFPPRAALGRLHA